MNREKEKREGLEVTLYTPRSELRTPGLLLKGMLRDLLASRELAWCLLTRDIRAQYRQTVLGLLWAFITPIATALIFILLNRRNILNVGETAIPYPVYVLTGTILWQVFVDSLNAPLKAVASSKALLTKINFPKEALILSGMGQVVFQLAIKLIILLCVLILYRIPLSFGLLFSLSGILALILLGFTIGLILTPVGMLYTDIVHALTVLIAVWFIFTPVVYPPPTSYPLSLIAVINPVSPLLIGARDLATLGVLQNPVPFLIVGGLTVVALFIAWILYRITLPVLIERISA